MNPLQKDRLSRILFFSGIILLIIWIILDVYYWLIFIACALIITGVPFIQPISVLDEFEENSTRNDTLIPNNSLDET